MNKIFIFSGLLIFIVLVIKLLSKNGSDKSLKKEYKYTKKEHFMTGNELKCFNVLVSIMPQNFYVFPQVHLSHILDNKVIGQNWNAAFRHINQKSVDFLLCDKEALSPVLAIELDDKSHEREDRVSRDTEVERVLELSNLPLLRIRISDISNKSELLDKVQGAIKI